MLTSVPTTNLNWHVERAWPEIAFRGASGSPESIARTEKLFHPKTRSVIVNSFCPQSGSKSNPASTNGSFANISFISGVKLVGSHSGILICPLASVIEAIACESIIEGSFNMPPKFPEWWALSLKLTERSKFIPPLEPVNIVGIFCEIRGPSDAIKTSAFNNSLFCWQKAFNPGDPISSPISKRILKLNPSFFWTDNKELSALIFIKCCPLLSAVPRP